MIKHTCPLCNSKSYTVRSFVANAENDYIKPDYFSSDAPHTLLHECDFCGSIYPSYRFNATIFNNVYLQNKSSHNMGWATFERTQHKSLLDSKYLIFLDDIIGKSIQQFFTGSKSILLGEIGCPFISYSYTQFLRYSGNSINLKLHDNPSSIPARVSKFLINLSNIFVVLFWRSRRFISSMPTQLYKSPIHPAIKKTHITCSNLAFWSSGCIRYGQSCVQLSFNNKIFDEILSLGSLDYVHMFDIVTIINSFDHFDQPLLVLDKLMQHTKSIFILGHDSSNFGMQHRFALTIKSIQFLKGYIRKSYPNSTFHPISYNVGSYSEIGFYCFLRS